MPMNRDVVVGVDTHSAMHCAAVLDSNGRLLETAEFAATAIGYRRLVAWARRHGRPISFGVEGTGAYGAGLTRHLVGEGLEVREVPRPDRRLRRNRGKSDPLDAEAAARAVLSGAATVIPKLADGPIGSSPSRLARLGGTAAAPTWCGRTLWRKPEPAPCPPVEQHRPDADSNEREQRTPHHTGDGPPKTARPFPPVGLPAMLVLAARRDASRRHDAGRDARSGEGQSRYICHLQHRQNGSPAEANAGGRARSVRERTDSSGHERSPAVRQNGL